VSNKCKNGVESEISTQLALLNLLNTCVNEANFVLKFAVVVVYFVYYLLSHVIYVFFVLCLAVIAWLLCSMSPSQQFYFFLWFVLLCYKPHIVAKWYT